MHGLMRQKLLEKLQMTDRNHNRVENQSAKHINENGVLNATISRYTDVMQLSI